MATTTSQKLDLGTVAEAPLATRLYCRVDDRRTNWCEMVLARRLGRALTSPTYLMAGLRKYKRRYSSPEHRGRRRLRRLNLVEGDVAIDCGAHVGEIAEILGASGATVYCFEPNPAAYEVLQRRFDGRPNFVCFQAAVLDADSTMELFTHSRSTEDPVRWATNSSLYAKKPGLSEDASTIVDVVDLARFIDELDTTVSVLKMDIEGAEVAVLRALLDRGILDRISHVFVETHEDRLPEISGDLDDLRSEFARRKFGHVHLDWA